MINTINWFDIYPCIFRSYSNHICWIKFTTYIIAHEKRS